MSGIHRMHGNSRPTFKSNATANRSNQFNPKELPKTDDVEDLHIFDRAHSSTMAIAQPCQLKSVHDQIAEKSYGFDGLLGTAPRFDRTVGIAR